jgi:hypothetical protein
VYNYGYRDYNPVAARFTTVNPIRDGTNWFAYVNNDPVNWVDPFGLLPHILAGAGGLVGGVKPGDTFEMNIYNDFHKSEW